MTAITGSTRGLTPRRLFGVVATAECITWALLIIGMIAKYGFSFDALIGPFGGLHGFVFLSYVATSVFVGGNQRWTAGTIAASVAFAIVPFATVPWERSLVRRGMLTGAWRTEAGDDPRDQRMLDRLLRWSIRHALLALIVVVALVAVVFFVLLQLGPPTEWGR